MYHYTYVYIYICTYIYIYVYTCICMYVQSDTVERLSKAKEPPFLLGSGPLQHLITMVTTIR